MRVTVFFLSKAGRIDPFTKSIAIAELETNTKEARVDMDAAKISIRIKTPIHSGKAILTMWGMIKSGLGTPPTVGISLLKKSLPKTPEK